ncbi:MAG: hypothetical protein Q7J04_08155, partial [Microcella sp.]|nr:hypothetical protein [Microcella sp.]
GGIDYFSAIVTDRDRVTISNAIQDAFLVAVGAFVPIVLQLTWRWHSSGRRTSNISALEPIAQVPEKGPTAGRTKPLKVGRNSQKSKPSKKRGSKRSKKN